MKSLDEESDESHIILLSARLLPMTRVNTTVNFLKYPARDSNNFSR
jgi:hypothetical protein